MGSHSEPAGLDHVRAGGDRRAYRLPKRPLSEAFGGAGGHHLLRVPQDRSGHFSTQVFEQYQRSEKALVAAPAQMYVQGGQHAQGGRTVVVRIFPDEASCLRLIRAIAAETHEEWM